MRSISGAGLAKLATKKGTEPIVILEIDWSPNATVSYADRDIASGIKGNILQVGDLDNVIDVLNSNSSQELSVVLNDQDGSIKDIMDTQDIHQRDVRVYQWFEGLDISDKFLLFAGKISSPVTWSEADRSVSFTIISQLEDKEFGFSAEEGQFPFVPRELVGKPWPVIFGTVLDCPALQVNKAVSGSTLCGVGILSGADLHNQVNIGNTDCGLDMSLAMMAQQASFVGVCADAWRDVDDDKADELIDQLNQLNVSITQAASGKAQQLNCAITQRSNKIADAQENGEGCNPVRILGGEDFPQEIPIKLNINGGLFTGIMRNDEFTISSREHPENDAKAQTVFNSIADTQCETPTPTQFFDFSMEVPGGSIRRRGFIVCNQDQVSRPSAPQVAQHFWAEAGSRAVIHGDEPITYIVSITPGTVLAVKAFKTLDGVTKLVNVPNDLWYTETQVYGSITAVQVVTRRPLSSIIEQGWSDDLYVTFESTIGPNTVDILEYIIENWTDLSFDTTSFDYVKAKLEPFPSNFPVLNRRNTLDLIKDIAFQSRCAIWLSNGVFYLKYLPEEPSADKAITVSDIESQTISVSLTPTEDLVTKMSITWWLSYAEEEPNKIILRHNVNKYGTKEEAYEWFIYNQPDIILKAATFWLIRKSNTWKKIRFKGFLNLLALETFDCIDLQTAAQRYVSSENIKVVVEKANYNSESNSMDFECLVPVKAGTMTKYKFFWPSSLTVSDTFPTPAEIAAGNAGGDGIGADATGELPVGYTDGINQGGTVFVGGPNVVFRANSDRGDRTPTDSGFTAQTIIPGTVFADLISSANPNPDLTLNYIDPLPQMPSIAVPSSRYVIDIRNTKIVDSDNPGRTAFLDDLFLEVGATGLVVDAEHQIGDGTNVESFDFQFDPETGKFGAGTAFLQDD